MRALTLRRVARPVLAALTIGVLVPVAAVATGEATTSETYRRPASGVFQFAGHGWGHGHGMSQWGAQGAATLGKTWDEIIRFYYPNTQLVQVPESENSIRVWLSVDDESDLRVVPATGLQVRDMASNVSRPLLAEPGVDMWRVVQTASAQRLQKRVNGSWELSDIDGQTDHVGPLRFSRPDDGWLTVAMPDGKLKPYRGVVQATRTSATAMHTVNVLAMDAYLRGVVPHESPAGFKAEALKAQSVAARTYSSFKRANAKNLSSGKYYDICDTTACQVYSGMTGEAASTNAAIDATAGMTVMYQGSPAFTEFSSSNGGWSTDGRKPYLIAQKDPWDGVAPNTVHSWTGQITVAQLEAAFPAVGRLSSLTVLSRDGNGEWGGRVLDVQLAGTDANGQPTLVTTTGRGILKAREWPTYKTPNGLRSNWWTITNADAQLSVRSKAPTLVAGDVAEARATVTARFTVLGTDAFAVSALTLQPASGGTDPFSKSPGRFVRNLTTPGATTVRPGETFEMAVDLDASALTPGEYTAAYRLADSGVAFGDPVSWVLTVAAPRVSGEVVGLTVAGTPARIAGSTVVVPVNGTRTVRATVRNTGNTTWPAALALKSAAASAPLSGDAVKPGGTATADIVLAGGGLAAGTTTETFRLTGAGGDIPGVAPSLAVVRVDPVRGLGRLPAAVSAYVDGKKRVNVVVSGLDARVERRTLIAGEWSEPASLGQPVRGRATVARAAGGVSVTVAQGLDGRLWWRTSAAPTWSRAPLAIRDEPAAVAVANGRVLVVARGTDNAVRAAYWSPSAGLGRFVRLAGVMDSGLAVSYGPMGALIAAVDSNGSVAVNRLTGGSWTGWTRLAGAASNAAPALAVDSTGAARLFARGADGVLLTRTRGASGRWTGPTRLGGSLTGGPGAVAAGAAVSVYARFDDGRVHVRSRGGSGWGPWAIAF